MWEKIIFCASMCVLTFSFISKKISYSEPSKLSFHLKFFVYYFLCSLLAFVIWPLFLFRPRNVKNSRLAATILKHITKLYDLKWELRGANILSEERGAVVVSNHQSSLDILGLFNIWEVADKLTAVAKREVMYVFPFGFAAYLAGVIYIDRNDPKRAREQLNMTSDVMVKEKTKIWLFPEGTRNKDYRSLLPFKKGAFHMAVAAQVPIIPVVFSPYYFINNKQGIFNKGHVIIQCLEPISTKGLGPEDIDGLVTRVRDAMSTVYKELTKEVITNLPSDYPHTTVG
ncbi:PREDICTED: 1-acyl-sn-glycerol-3-phosphate acyltransferase alpha-like isoform X1 [Papilio xuthus]|uniref:1-acyl-sn-glycerol-3-phosphate acyltransferase n=1 Tax=Papilio xuthus TaxID=66420 RepID=A0AAJ6Z746_PAPXU